MKKTNNTVELIGYYGGDLEHALSAWTSTNRDLTDDKRNRIPSLLEMLATNGHETPFEKSSLHFLITTEVATHIQVIKHRISVSVNAESARYKELKDDKYYIPDDWVLDEQLALINHCEESLKKYHECLKSLKIKGYSTKRAKETARFYLPYANQITSDVMFNFRSFVNFQRLRNSEHAQKEIRDLAQSMLDLVKNIEGNPFEYSLKGFGL